MVKLTVVPCPPVVEVKIKRPDTKYQLGFSVQNGVVSYERDPFFLLKFMASCGYDYVCVLQRGRAIVRKRGKFL